MHSVGKGDLLKLNIGPSEGHEQQGYRPCLVVSSTMFNNATGFAWVIPVTSRIKNRPEEIALPESSPIQGVLLTSQIKAVDLTARHFVKAGAVSDEFMDEHLIGRLVAVLTD